MELCDLVVHVLARPLQREAQAARLARQPARLRQRDVEARLRSLERRLRDADAHLVRLLVERHQHVALVHAVVVVDQHPRHLPRHAGGDEGDVPAHVGVVGGDRGEGAVEPGDHEEEQDQRAQHREALEGAPPRQPDPIEPLHEPKRRARKGWRSCGRRLGFWSHRLTSRHRC